MYDYNNVMLYVYTDGACTGNPGPGGYAIIVLDYEELSGGELYTTNNYMELLPILLVLEKYPNEEMTIFSDSAYVVNGFNNWLNNWAKNQWKKADKKPIKHLDMWQKIYSIKMQNPLIYVKKVKAHSGDYYNDRADQLAKQAILDLEISK